MSWRGRAVVAAVAVLTGFAGSALAVRVSGYPGPPEQVAAVAAVSSSVGRAPSATTGPTVHCSFWCLDPAVPVEGVVSYDSPPDRTDVTTVTFTSPGPSGPPGTSGALDTSPRAGLTLALADEPGNGAAFSVIVAKSLSVPAVVLAVAGLLIGGAAGGLASHRLLRRHRRHSRGRRAITEVLISITAAAAAGYAALTVMLIANNTATGRWRPTDVQTAEFILTAFWPATLAAVVAGALAVLSVLVRARPTG
ncbi:hypothetical protein AB0M54_43680 [Actinoplanes sp. NPDC051470]|uniref:hypothetical protein n=1 Tax=unclassified Actinoplanes TaxID=2626549 RepID=UPI0034372230